MVYCVSNTIEMRAVSAAIHMPGRFDTVTDDAIAALLAFGRKSPDCALERVECMRLTVHRYHERIVVIVATLLANSHIKPP